MEPNSEEIPIVVTIGTIELLCQYGSIRAAEIAFSWAREHKNEYSGCRDRLKAIKEFLKKAKVKEDRYGPGCLLRLEREEVRRHVRSGAYTGEELENVTKIPPEEVLVFGNIQS